MTQTYTGYYAFVQRDGSVIGTSRVNTSVNLKTLERYSCFEISHLKITKEEARKYDKMLSRKARAIEKRSRLMRKIEQADSQIKNLKISLISSGHRILPFVRYLTSF